MILELESCLARLAATLRAGGVVMAPLAAVCLLMWLLIFERLFCFRRLGRRDMSPQQAWEYIRERRPAARPGGCGAVARLAAEFAQRRGTCRSQDGRILEEALQTRLNRLADRQTLIGVLAAVAPLLGLLGTVTGMMATFEVLAVFGTGNAQAMANGISEALITTQSGLLVAIPGLFMKHLLDRRADDLRHRLGAAGHYLARQLRRRNDTIPGECRP